MLFCFQWWGLFFFLQENIHHFLSIPVVQNDSLEFSKEGDRRNSRNPAGYCMLYVTCLLNQLMDICSHNDWEHLHTS